MAELIVIGLNHRTTPIEIRERLAFKEQDMEKALLQVNSLPSLKEGMILSTCNRVEIYALARESENAFKNLKNFLSQYHDLPLKDFEDGLYLLKGNEAVRHIFRVASSLDSMVVGEPQILGQIKSAYNIAVELKTSGIILHRLMHRAFHVAKRIRSETRISNSAVSVSSIAVELAKKIFGTLEKRRVLLIGAGEMSELAARYLLSGGVEKIIIVNRTYERALELAREFNGDAIPFEEINQGLKLVDIVISATDSPTYLIRHEQVSKVMKERKQRPIFFIDIADPRDIEPKIGNIANVYLYNIDDLQKVANENIKDRQKEAQKAEAIIEDEVIKFVNWYRSLEVTPTIIALKKKFDEIRRKELEKTLSLHPHLSEDEKKSLDALTQAIINKILHNPITILKSSQEDAFSELYIDTVRKIFGLSENSSKASEKKPEDEEKEEQDARI